MKEVYHEHNKRSTKKLWKIDILKLSITQVLIKVEAASYNYNDLWGIWRTN